MSTGNFTVRRTINETECKYKIITAGSKFAVPVGMPIIIRFGSSLKEYNAKMHSKTVGRIDGLTDFYRDSNLQVGDEITISYDASLNMIHVSLSAQKLTKPGFQEAGGDVSGFESGDVGFGFGDDGGTKGLGGTLAGTEMNVNWCEVEANGLGIVDSDRWKDLPYKSCMPAHSSGEFAAASDDNYVVIANEQYYSGPKIYIFDRNTKKCHYVTPYQ